MIEADWSLVPEHMRDGLDLYFTRGIPPGGFMRAVLANDLFDAAGRADHMNRMRLADIALFVGSYAPPGSFGSREIVQAWIESGGLRGREKLS